VALRSAQPPARPAAARESSSRPPRHTRYRSRMIMGGASDPCYNLMRRSSRILEGESRWRVRLREIPRSAAPPAATITPVQRHSPSTTVAAAGYDSFPNPLPLILSASPRRSRHVNPKSTVGRQLFLRPIFSDRRKSVARAHLSIAPSIPRQSVLRPTNEVEKARRVRGATKNALPILPLKWAQRRRLFYDPEAVCFFKMVGVLGRFTRQTPGYATLPTTGLSWEKSPSLDARAGTNNPRTHTLR